MKYKLLNYTSFFVLAIVLFFVIISFIFTIFYRNLEVDDLLALLLIITIGFIILSKQLWFQLKIINFIKQKDYVQTNINFCWFLWAIFAIFSLSCFYFIYESVKSLLTIKSFTLNNYGNKSLYITQIVSIIFFSIIGIINISISIFDIFILIQLKNHNNSITQNSVNSIGN